MIYFFKTKKNSKKRNVSGYEQTKKLLSFLMK